MKDQNRAQVSRHFRERYKEKNKHLDPFVDGVKTCHHCKMTKKKTRENWNKDSGSYDGLDGRCRDCNIKRKRKRRTNSKKSIFKRIQWLSKQLKNHKRYRGLGELSYSDDQWEEKLNRQGWRCALSGVVLKAENVSIDHLIPVSKGGTNDFDNLRLLDVGVNLALRHLSDSEFILMCNKVTKFNGGSFEET